MSWETFSRYKWVWYGAAVMAGVGALGAIASGRPEGVVGWAFLMIPYGLYRLKGRNSTAEPV